MPTLKDWCVLGFDRDNGEPATVYTPPECVEQRLNGIVDGHLNQDPKHEVANGEYATTGPIVGKRNGKVVTESGSEYDLLEVRADYAEKFPDAKERLINTLPELV